MREVLVVANRTLGGAKLLEAVRARAAAGDVRFRLVVPQSKPSAGLVIYDEAVRESAQVRVDLATSMMAAEGIEVIGAVGDPDPFRQALAFKGLGARRVVVTRGEHGSIVVSDALRLRLGAYPTEYVDGTGGGDSFDAGYIAGLIEGLPELDCLRLASAVGASCVRAGDCKPGSSAVDSSFSASASSSCCPCDRKERT